MCQKLVTCHMCCLSCEIFKVSNVCILILICQDSICIVFDYCKVVVPYDNLLLIQNLSVYNIHYIYIQMCLHIIRYTIEYTISVSHTSINQGHTRFILSYQSQILSAGWDNVSPENKWMICCESNPIKCPRPILRTWIYVLSVYSYGFQIVCMYTPP